MRVLQCLDNPVEHTLDVPQNIIVPEAKDSVAVALQKRRARRIGFSRARVLPVDDVDPDRMLSAELHVLESPISESCPELALRVR